jgi:hypothetical protein
MIGITVLIMTVIGLLVFLGFCAHETNVHLRQIAENTLITSRYCERLAKTHGLRDVDV